MAKTATAAKTDSKSKAKKTAGESASTVKTPRATRPKKGLVIVESPSKAKTIQKYLGREFVVKASVGHVKDLPKSKLGVDPDHGFKTDYQLIPTKVKVIDELKKASENVPELYLATDPDREGEAIAWHINEELNTQGKKVHRVLFNSITKPSILEAMSKPQTLDSDKYHAQQARRILDRLVGYKISPLLWDKVKRGISAGRVQSVALRLAVDREAEIKKFKPVEYWKIEGLFARSGVEMATRYFKVDGSDPELGKRADVDAFLSGAQGAAWKVKSIEQKERSRKPTSPFTTSKMQQEAASKLGFSAKKTMTIAQHLYEGKDLGDHGTHGLITYMRTDSVRIDPGALETLRSFIGEKYGKDYLPAEPNAYKAKKGAQEAHEAIRPTSLEFTPELVQPFLDKDEFRLYQLVWNRFIASQMTPAIFDATAVDIAANDKGGHEHVFRATGSVIKFPGFQAVYLESAEERQSGGKSGTDEAAEAADERSLKLPPGLKEGDAMEAKAFNPTQHFTQPPPRYTDASLIRDLEEKGIGRPSTYASILSNIQDREYVEKLGGRFHPTELGIVVTDLLVQSFPEILNAEFTAGMEDQLDEIEAGQADWKKTLGSFWKPFEKTLESAKTHMKNVKRQEVPTDIKCEKCGHTMVIKWGKLGSFLACSNYPDCKNTQDFKKNDEGRILIVPKEFTDKKCEECGNPLVVKGGKFGKFLACSDYPNCKFTAPVTLGIPCPKCKQGEIAQKQSRYKRIFYSCTRWPDCDFAAWDKPVLKPCPDCKFDIVTEKITKRQGLIHKCPVKECGWMEVIDPNPTGETAEEAATA